ncbi:MAG: rhodanese-like domain-containing protein [Anaerolineae bacterium]
MKRTMRRSISPIVLTIGMIGILLTGALLAGCGFTAEAATGAQDQQVLDAAVTAEVSLGPEVDPDTVATLSAEGAIAVLDVREEWEFAEGHIPGATLVPLGSLRQRTSEIPTDIPVVLVCRSGNRSGQAYRYLLEQGFSNVHNMTGGMIAWQARGHEVER